MYHLLSHEKSEKEDHQRAATSSSAVIPSEFREEAIFAAGSFWTAETAFGCVDGVLSTSTGYFGGTLWKITYREVQNVSDANTGHTEAVEIVYDKRSVSFTSLCEVFWDTHDPTSKEFLVIPQNFSLLKIARHIRLSECLNLRSTEQFVDSHIACKLNGYLGGDPANIGKHKEALQRLIYGSDASMDAKNILESILHSLSRC